MVPPPGCAVCPSVSTGPAPPEAQPFDFHGSRWARGASGQNQVPVNVPIEHNVWRVQGLAGKFVSSGNGLMFRNNLLISQSASLTSGNPYSRTRFRKVPPRTNFVPELHARHSAELLNNSTCSWSASGQSFSERPFGQWRKVWASSRSS